MMNYAYLGILNHYESLLFHTFPLIGLLSVSRIMRYHESISFVESFEAAKGRSALGTGISVPTAALGSLAREELKIWQIKMIPMRRMSITSMATGPLHIFRQKSLLPQLCSQSYIAQKEC